MDHNREELCGKMLPALLLPAIVGLVLVTGVCKPAIGFTGGNQRPKNVNCGETPVRSEADTSGVSAGSAAAPEAQGPEEPKSSSSSPDKVALKPISLVRNRLVKMLTPHDNDPMISTDRNSVTPHPNAVPLGYLQVENGITLDKFHHGGDFIASETNVRLGAWPYGELRFQAPNYLKSWGFDDREEGTTDILVGIKQEIEPPFLRRRGIDLGVIVGTSVPTGSHQLSTRRVDPFVQMIVFQKLLKHYILGTSHSIFLPSEALEAEETGAIIHNRNLTYQPTVILFRALGDRIDIWGEYAGQFFERGSSIQIMDFGGVWRPRKRHQVDFRFGVGLTDESPRAFIGMGYSVLIGKTLPY